VTKTLSDLLQRDLPDNPVITGVTADSRKVGPGTLFAALPGTKVDGASFAPGAIAAGAAAVLGPVGMGDFSASMGVTNKNVGQTDGYPGDIWHYARFRLIMACRAAGIDPVDGPLRCPETRAIPAAGRIVVP